jgi:hypothetical protein
MRALPLLLTLTACCPEPGVKVIGTPASGAERVFAEATRRFPSIARASGTVTWVEPGTMKTCGISTYEKGVAGCTTFGGCAPFLFVGRDVGTYVITLERLEPVTASALAHELCHVAGYDEAGAPGCARDINDSITY